MSRTEEDWRAALASWLSPFLQHLGHKARRRMCPVYVAGLIGAGERKSLQPTAARLAPADYDSFIISSVTVFGTRRRSRANSSAKPTAWWVGRMPCW